MKKRIAWMLVAAMSLTSVSNSALVVNGAEILDFTDEGDTTSEDDDAQSEAVELEEENDFTSGENEDSQEEIFDSLIESAGTDENTKKSIKEIKAETSEIFAEPIWGSFPTKDQLLAHLYVDVIYEDGTTETVQGYGTTSQGDAMQIDFSGVEFNRGHAQKGEYKVPITIGDKTIEIIVDVDTVAGYCDRKAPLLTVNKAYSGHIAHQWQKAYFKFTAPEDGCYAFQCESSDNEEISLGCMNTNEQYLGNVVELNAGETVYLNATNYSEASVDFQIVPKKSYMIKDMELISSPKTEYVKGLDYSWNDYLDESKLDLKDLKVKVKYTDGNEEELGIDTIGRDDRKLQISIDYDWEIGNVINIKLDDSKIQIPLTNITLAEYLEKNSQNIETFSENETRKVEWNGWSGYIYKFVPSETSNYIYKIEDEEDLTERIYGYILDENGERIKNVDYDYITELEAGKTYYLLAIPCESVKGSSKIRFFKERKIQSIALDTKELVTYGNKIDDMYEQNIRDLVNESGIILKFTDGSEEKVKLGDTTPEGYTVDIEIPDIDFREYYKYNAQGSYALKLTAGDCSAEYTLKVLPEIEHLKQIAQEIKFNQKTQITIPKYSQGIYSMTAPETGYYNIECEENNSDLYITYLNENGESEDKRIQIEKNHKLFIVINNYSTDESVTTGITVKTLGEELVRVYLKQYPKNTTYIQKVDGELEDEEGVSYT